MTTTPEQVKQSLELYINKYAWSVFPVKHDKRPLGPWKEYQQKIIGSVDEFKEVVKQHSSKDNIFTGIAVITGAISGLVVVDIDFKNGAEDICKDIIAPKVRTPSGGLHYYFAYEEGIKNSVGIVKGVDIRADGGYVVAPPSFVADKTDEGFTNQKYYTWERTIEECGMFIPPLPQFVKDLIDKAPAEKFKRLEAMPEVAIGNRNVSLAQVIGVLIRVIDQDRWFSFVLPLIHTWNLGLADPLPETEVEATFNSIVKTELKNHFYLDNNDLEKAVKPEQDSDIETIIKTLFDLDVIKGRPTGIKAVDRITGGIRKGTSVVLIADTNMGKSILIQNIMVNMAKSDGIKSTIFDLENGANQVWQRLLMIWFGLRVEYFYDTNNVEDTKNKIAEVSKYITVYTHDKLDELLTSKNGTEKDMPRLLTALIDKHKSEGCEMFLIDPLQELETEVDSGKSFQEQGRLIRMFKNQALELSITTFICHHLKKAQRNARRVDEDEDLMAQKSDIIIPTADDAKGSGKIKDSTTDMWGFVRFRNSQDDFKRAQSRLEVLKTRSKFSGAGIMFFDEITLRFVNNTNELSITEPNLFNQKVTENQENVLSQLLTPLV